MGSINFVFDLTRLHPADIILIKTDEELCARMKSDYNHALLYVGRGCYLDSDSPGVGAQNIQRLGFENMNDSVVLRLANPVSELLLEIMFVWARRIVGMEYSLREALLVEASREGNHPHDRQFCTRYVAQAYQMLGVDIVANPNYCSPQDILNSDRLQRQGSCLRRVTPFDLKICNDQSDVINDQTIINAEILKSARKILGIDVQTLESAIIELAKQPNKDAEMTDMLTASGYLQLYDRLYSENKWLIDKDAFRQEYIDDISQLNAINQVRQDSEFNRRMYLLNLASLQFMYSKYPLRFIKEHMDLYQKLVDTMEVQINMVDELDAELTEEILSDPKRLDLLMKSIAENKRLYESLNE